MQVTTNSLDAYWMPFTANRDFKDEPRLLVKGEGVYYWNHKGEKILDGTAGLFCCALGHGRKEIIDAVSHQLSELDYSPSFNIGHPGPFELASKIAALTPDTLNHIFFVNSGSEAIDSAMKIALAYHRSNGQAQRQRFVSRERSYHGVNFGGTSLSGLMKNRETFGTLLPGIHHMRHTHLPEHSFVRGQPETGADLAEDLQRICELVGGDTIAACIVEPIAGSTGILVPPVGYLDRLREICDRHGILLIFDEVICGFGRSGKTFAAQSFNVTPDMMTLAKAITNAVQPMGAVAVKDEIYATIVDKAPPGAIELFHGYTYSAHPAACAAGLATLAIYERENTFEKAAELSPYFLDAIFSLKDSPLIKDIRGYGLLAGVEVVPGAAPGQRGYEMMKELFWEGLHIKFTGDVGCVSPPLIFSRDNVDEMMRIWRRVLARHGG
jgi:beta-alanine--pyruvate transaminase